MLEAELGVTVTDDQYFLSIWRNIGVRKHLYPNIYIARALKSKLSWHAIELIDTEPSRHTRHLGQRPPPPSAPAIERAIDGWLPLGAYRQRVWSLVSNELALVMPPSLVSSLDRYLIRHRPTVGIRHR